MNQIDQAMIMEQPRRSQYHPPSVIEYGALSDITRAVDNNGPSDGGKGSMDKTGIPVGMM